MANLLSEELAIVACIDPDNRASSTTLSDAIDMSVHDRVMFIVAVGAMQLSARTYDFKVVECATSGGTYTPISGKSITQLTGADANKQVIVNVQASDLSDGYRYIKGRLYVGGVTGTGANESAVIALAGVTRFSDAVTSTSYGDLASVDEIVN
jgi:hypothetical protein